VVTEAANARSASDENARRANDVVQALARAGVAGKDIRTQGLALIPVYDNRPNDTPRIRAYRATNQVVVTTTNLAQVGQLLDEATRAGANVAGGLQLGLTDPVTAQTAAYRQATREALQRATAMAEAIGKKITRVVEIRTIDLGMPRPFMMETTLARTAAAPPSTPVEPGESTTAAPAASANRVTAASWPRVPPPALIATLADLAIISAARSISASPAGASFGKPG